MSAAKAPTSGAAVVWSRFWNDVDNPAWLAARDLLDLCPTVRRFFAGYLDVDEEGVWLDWTTAAEHLADTGFSSTEGRLALLVAALTTGTPVDIGLLDSMGSWQDDVWAVMTSWATEGRLHLVDAYGNRP
jgi:hypothetical protein